MADALILIHGIPVYIYPPEGKLWESEGDAIEIIGDAGYEGAQIVAVPTERLTRDFFNLRSGLAGQIMQKFVTYQMRLVIIGDISAYTAQSRALSSLVVESNHGEHIWFLRDMAELEARLSRIPRPAPNGDAPPTEP